MSNPCKNTEYRHWFISPTKEILISCLFSREQREKKKIRGRKNNTGINKEEIQL